MQIRFWPIFVVLLLAFVGYLQRGLFTVDSDFGWHIRAGEYILAHGIPYKDPFSYAMPSYLFVDHEWLTNVIWTLTMSHIGYWPLAVAYALLGVAAIVIQFPLTKKKWLLIPVFLTAGTLLDFVGVRTQVIDWLLLSMLIVVLWKKDIWEKWRFFLPLLFLFWANVHGGFGIGLGVLGIVFVTRSIEERKGIKQNFFLLAVCVLITLVNPFGIRLWGEFWNQLSDTNLRWSIEEWYPVVYFTNFSFWIYLILSVFLIIRYRRKYSLTELTLYGVFLLAAVGSIRNIPLWMIISFSLTARGFYLLGKEAAQHLYGIDRFKIFYYGFFIIVCVFFATQWGIYYYSEYLSRGEGSGYPVKAVTYLHRHLPKGQIFSSYNWGGYLLWNLPEKKDFIDGRMPSWRWHLNSPTESNYAFVDYVNVLEQKTPFAPFATKFHITTILVPTPDLKKPVIKFFGIPVKNNTLLKQLLDSGLPNFTFYNVSNEAKKLGWVEVYHDKTATIFEKR